MPAADKWVLNWVDASQALIFQQKNVIADRIFEQSCSIRNFFLLIIANKGPAPTDKKDDKDTKKKKREDESLIRRDVMEFSLREKMDGDVLCHAQLSIEDIQDSVCGTWTCNANI